MKNRLKNMKFRVKMQMAFLLATLLPLLLLGIFCLRLSYQSLDREIRVGIRNYSRKTSDMLGRNIRQVEAQLDKIVYDDDFLQLLKDVEYNEASLSEVQAACKRLQFSTSLVSARIHSVEVVFRKEVVLSWQSHRTREILAEIDSSGLRTEREIWYPDENRLYLIREAYDDYNNEPLARVVIVIDGNLFFKDALGDVDEDYGVLLAFHGERYAYTEASSVMVSGIPSVGTLQNAGDKVFSFNGRQYLVEGYPLEGTQIVLYSVASYDSAVRTIHEVSIAILAVLSASLLTVSLGSFIFSARFTRRIEGIIEQIENVSTGNFKVSFTDNGEDEIGQLQTAFTELVDQLDVLMIDVYESRLAQKELRLKALQAQINPHFLYNCLDNLNWHAIMNGDDHANQVINQLSLFYRTSLNHGNDFTTVEKELSNASAYMALQLDLHENSFVFDMEVEEGLEQYSIVSLVLQPILENAVNHGIHQMDEGEQGCIRLRAASEKELLVFTVDNTGPPIAEDTAYQVLTTKGKGYGVSNVNERLKLFFGQGYGIRLSPLAAGTRCTLTIPARLDIEEAET